MFGHFDPFLAYFLPWGCLWTWTSSPSLLFSPLVRQPEESGQITLRRIWCMGLDTKHWLKMLLVTEFVCIYLKYTDNTPFIQSLGYLDIKKQVHAMQIHAHALKSDESSLSILSPSTKTRFFHSLFVKFRLEGGIIEIQRFFPDTLYWWALHSVARLWCGEIEVFVLSLHRSSWCF